MSALDIATAMAQMLFGEIRDLPFADTLEVTSTVFGVKADQTLLVVLGRATGRESTAAFDAPVQVGGMHPIRRTSALSSAQTKPADVLQAVVVRGSRVGDGTLSHRQSVSNRPE